MMARLAAQEAPMAEPQALILSETVAWLDSLAATAAHSTPATVIAQARALLGALCRAPAAPVLPETAPGGWSASREQDPKTGERHILCWNRASDTLLAGDWSGDNLVEVRFQAGDDFWFVRADGGRETLLSSQEELDAHAEEVRDQALRSRMQAAWQQRASETAQTQGQPCPQCGWRNQPGETTCSMCLATLPPAAASSFGGQVAKERRPGDQAPTAGSGGSRIDQTKAELAKRAEDLLTREARGKVTRALREVLEQELAAKEHAAPPKVRCPQCRHENEPGAKYCSECGARLGTAEAG
jgi:hypothetical protein